MKILIAYDGSKCANDALDDLKRAGLPRQAQASVISVAELWIALPSSHDFLEPSPVERPPGGEREALTLASNACAYLRHQFPEWEIEAVSVSGSPAREIIDKAENWRAELIVVGSRGQSGLSRFLLGSVSQKIVTEARCSVRVARDWTPSDHPARILIGLDGSPGADAAVRSVAGRFWPKGSEVRLVSSMGPPHHHSGDMIRVEEEYIHQLHELAKDEFRPACLEVSSMIASEDPKQSIVSEAKRWKADCIFVGTNSHGRLGRWLLGSVSTAVVSRAHCSVEVVRVTAEI
jgi:nucleotide-binding universal stress UspA family protein